MCTLNLVKFFDIWLWQEPYIIKLTHLLVCLSYLSLSLSGPRRLQNKARWFCCFLQSLVWAQKYYILLIHQKSNKWNIKLLTIFEPICLTMQSIWILWPAWRNEIFQTLLDILAKILMLSLKYSPNKKVFDQNPLNLSRKVPVHCSLSSL